MPEQELTIYITDADTDEPLATIHQPIEPGFTPEMLFNAAYALVQDFVQEWCPGRQVQFAYMRVEV